MLSGDNVIIRGQPKGGPPPERTLALSNIMAPRLGRRAAGESPETEDEVSIAQWQLFILLYIYYVILVQFVLIFVFYSLVLF